MANQLRTSSFRLHDPMLGEAHGYRFPVAFHEAWRQRNQELRRSGQDEQLPYASLATALCAITGDFIRLNPWGTDDRDPYFLISRVPIHHDRVRKAILGWEIALWPEREATLYAFAQDLEHVALDIASFVERRRGRTPIVRPRWVWEVAAWAAARGLATGMALDDDTSVRLHLDTEANLLTWDRLLGIPGRPNAFAMHKVTPRVISVPGVEDLVLHLDCSLTRFSRTWTGKERYAWAWRGTERLILRSPVRRAGGEFPRKMRWAGRDSEVLRQLEELPDPFHVLHPTGDSPVRATPPTLVAGYPLGTGPGQRFFELVASHVRATLPDIEGLTFTSARGRLRQFNRPNSVKGDALPEVFSEGGVTFVVLYSTAECRNRMARALGNILGLADVPSDGVLVDLGPTRVVFERPDSTGTALLQPGDVTLRERATKEIVQKWARSGTRLAFLVQTLKDRTSLRTNEDPKHQLRRLLAQAGVVSQFVAHDVGDQDPEKDYAAENAVWDLLRSTGTLPEVVPVLENGPGGATWAVGAAVVQQHGRNPGDRARRRGRGYVVSLVAVKAGSRLALGFDFANGKWEALGQATAAFLAGDHNSRGGEAATTIEGAVDQLLTRHPADRAVVFMEAQGVRRLWGGLADPGEGVLPRFASDPRAAIVRVRTETGELPRPAGDGTWEEPRKNGMTDKLMKIVGVHGDHAFFYVDPPPVAAAKGGSRTLQQTRFAVARGPFPKQLADNWQTASATEFWCRASGVFKGDELCAYGAELCRAAPTWTRTLRLPAPLHLAWCLIEDHPDRYVARPEEDEAVDDEEPSSTDACATPSASC